MCYSNNGLCYAACVARVTIFSIGSKFCLLNFMESHILTLAAILYALLLILMHRCWRTGTCLSLWWSLSWWMWSSSRWCQRWMVSVLIWIELEIMSSLQGPMWVGRKEGGGEWREEREEREDREAGRAQEGGMWGRERGEGRERREGEKGEKGEVGRSSVAIRRERAVNFRWSGVRGNAYSRPSLLNIHYTLCRMVGKYL